MGQRARLAEEGWQRTRGSRPQHPLCDMELVHQSLHEDSCQASHHRLSGNHSVPSLRPGQRPGFCGHPDLDAQPGTTMVQVCDIPLLLRASVSFSVRTRALELLDRRLEKTIRSYVLWAQPGRSSVLCHGARQRRGLRGCVQGSLPSVAPGPGPRGMPKFLSDKLHTSVGCSAAVGSMHASNAY